ncbi:MAG: DUF721 domain-containing protein [Bacteroidales bacterium]|nr:DUF721 domain-containing protein [Bacteroidales bacterium]
MSRVARKTADPLSVILREFIRDNHLTPGLNTRRIFAAWDAASGAGRYTVRRFFRDGKLYVTVDSSVVRSQLSFQREALLGKINAILEKDELFIAGDKRVGYVKELILK